MTALLRHPLYQLLLRLWWVPALSIAAAWALFGGVGLITVGPMVLFLAAAAGGAALAAGAGAARAALADSARHEQLDHRFFCPKCMRFGPRRYACGACGQEVEGLIVHTSGEWVNDCRHCHAALFERDCEAGAGVRALCARCGATGDRDRLLERQVVLVGIPTSEGLNRLHDSAPALQWTAGPGYLCADDGRRLVYALDLAALPEPAPGTRPDADSALASLDALWIDPETEPLELGRNVDRLFRINRDYLAGRMPEVLLAGNPAPAARNLVMGRFAHVRTCASLGVLLGSSLTPATRMRVPGSPGGRAEPDSLGSNPIGAEVPDPGSSPFPLREGGRGVGPPEDPGCLPS